MHWPRAIKVQTEAVAALSDPSAALKNHARAAQIGILTIAVILLWQSFAPKKIKLLPGPLVAILIAAGIAALSMPVLYVEVPNNLWNEILNHASNHEILSANRGVCFLTLPSDQVTTGGPSPARRKVQLP